jgi:hypothetical protein
MSEFYKEFLLEDLRRPEAHSTRNVFLAAFGKHPGWDDHIEDLGLETPSLVAARKLLYVEGLGGQIDSGAWEKLEPSQQIPVFKHTFVWLRGPHFLVGRMWSSSDGKGRTRYPMIVCAQAAGVSLDWFLDLVLPGLERVEQACLLTAVASEVRTTLSRACTELRDAVFHSSTNINPPMVTPEALARFLAHPDLGPQQEGWLRVLYQMDGQMAAFRTGRFDPRGDVQATRAQGIRVPACGESPAQTLVLWARFFLAQFDPGAPLLLLLPMEERWLDCIVGEPASHDFFCLRASPKAVPLASEVPYNLDELFRERARQRLEAFRTGVASGASVPPGGGPGAGRAESASPSRRFLRWLTG